MHLAEYVETRIYIQLCNVQVALLYLCLSECNWITLAHCSIWWMSVLVYYASIACVCGYCLLREVWGLSYVKFFYHYTKGESAIEHTHMGNTCMAHLHSRETSDVDTTQPVEPLLTTAEEPNQNQWWTYLEKQYSQHCMHSFLNPLHNVPSSTQKYPFLNWM